MQTHQPLAQEFYENLLQLGYQPRYSRSRYHCLMEFLEWTRQAGYDELGALTAEDLQAYHGHLSARSAKGHQKKDSLHPRTVHSYMNTVKDFFLWLETCHQLEANPFHRFQFSYPKEALCQRTILTSKEMKELYQHAFSGVEKALLGLAYGCGLRAGEIESCKVEDFRWEEKLLIVPKGKGNKRRVIPMSEQVLRDLSEYAHEHRRRRCRGRDWHAGQKAFLLHSRGGRMRKNTLNALLKRIIRRTEKPDLIRKTITLHSLRHSIATHLLEGGMEVNQVRRFLGHKHLETTQVYTHVSKDQLKHIYSNEENHP